MAKIILYIACSVDCFIARKNGENDWLREFENTSEDYGYSEFYKKIDVVIMGNNTYKQVLAFGEFPHKDRKCFVFTRQQKKQDENTEFVEFVNCSAEEFVQTRLKNKTAWLVGGSELIQEFLKHDVIDEVIISVIPILLGEGIPLFKGGLEKKLTLVRVKEFKPGIVQLHYKK